MRIVLNLKRVPYEYVAIPSLSSAAYRKLNPQCLMPALEIDGRVVAQSMAIIELLEEIFPELIFCRTIQSSGPRRDRSRSLSRLIYIRSTTKVFDVTSPMCRAPTSRRSSRGIIPGLGNVSRLEAQLARRPVQYRFCFGDRPGLADACLVPQMDNARRFSCDLSRIFALWRLTLSAASSRIHAGCSLDAAGLPGRVKPILSLIAPRSRL